MVTLFCNRFYHQIKWNNIKALQVVCTKVNSNCNKLLFICMMSSNAQTCDHHAETNKNDEFSYEFMMTISRGPLFYETRWNRFSSDCLSLMLSKVLVLLFCENNVLICCIRFFHDRLYKKFAWYRPIWISRPSQKNTKIIHDLLHVVV